MSKAQASRAGDREFGSQSSKANDLKCLYLLLLSQALGIHY